jgi:hypothetical protein
VEGQSHSENISTKTAGGRNQPAKWKCENRVQELGGIYRWLGESRESKLPRNRRGTACCEMQSLLEG